MEFIVNSMQDVLWNPEEEMQVASGWPGTRNWGTREPWFVLDINWCTFSNFGLFSAHLLHSSVSANGLFLLLVHDR